MRLPLDLPADTEKALEAIAKGWTRTPTLAHPDCLCGGRAEFCPVSYTELPSGQIYVRRGWAKTIRCPIHSRRR